MRIATEPESRGEQEHDSWLEQQIRRADAVVLCCCCSSSSASSSNNTQDWIQRIRKASQQSRRESNGTVWRYIPIVLACTDGSASQPRLSGEKTHLAHCEDRADLCVGPYEDLEVESCIECSPHTRTNVSEGRAGRQTLLLSILHQAYETPCILFMRFCDSSLV